MDTTATAIVWEHSLNYNNYDGGLLCAANDTGHTPAYVAIRRTTSPAGYMMDTFPYTSNTWERFTAVINLGLPAGNTHEVVKVYRNGVLESTDKLIGGVPAALRNDIFYFGARANGIVPLKGWIDEMKIETVSNYVNLVANHSNLIGYWRLSEGSGTTAWEVRGLTGNGTYTNVASGDYAKPGAIRFDPDTAMRFNGTNSYVNAGNNSVLNGNWNGLTLMAWIKPEAASLSGIRAIIGKWNQTQAGDHYLLFLNDGKLGIAVGNGSTPQNGLLSQTTLLADQWYFVAGTWDKTTGAYQLYINGMLDPATGVQTAPWQINTGSTVPLIIGAQVHGVGRYFAGLIDEVAIFNTRLSQGEIFGLYALATVPEPSTWALAGVGLVSLIGLALRRRWFPVT